MIETKNSIHDPVGHTDAVRALATADNRLFSGSYDGTVKVWDVETLECLKTLAGHTGPVRTLVSSGGHMFSGSYDKTVSSCLYSCLPFLFEGQYIAAKALCHLEWTSQVGCFVLSSWCSAAAGESLGH